MKSWFHQVDSIICIISPWPYSRIITTSILNATPTLFFNIIVSPAIASPDYHQVLGLLTSLSKNTNSPNGMARGNIIFCIEFHNWTWQTYLLNSSVAFTPVPCRIENTTRCTNSQNYPIWPWARMDISRHQYNYNTFIAICLMILDGWFVWIQL